MLIGHGDDSSRYKKKIIADFSSNVRYDGTPCELLEHLQKILPRIASYPESDATGLCKLASQAWQLQDESILFTSGATEAFYMIAEMFRGAVSHIAAPSFQEYEDASLRYSSSIFFYPVKNLSSLSSNYIQRRIRRYLLHTKEQSTHIFWIANPSSPLGSVLHHKDIFSVLMKIKNTFTENSRSKIYFIIDESYLAFSEIDVSLKSYLTANPSLILVGSLTKSGGIPGLRCGYVAASKNIIQKLKEMLKPWSLNLLAQEAAKFLITHPHLMEINIKENLKRSMEFQQKIKELPSVKVYKSHTTYFTCRLTQESSLTNAARLKELLIDKYAVLIRDASNFHFLNERYFRVASLTYEKNQMLLEALRCLTIS